MHNSSLPTNHIKDGTCTIGVANQIIALCGEPIMSLTCKNVFILNSYPYSYLAKSLRLIRSMPYETVNPSVYTTTICAMCVHAKCLTPPVLRTTLCGCINVLVVRLKGIKGGVPL